MSKRPSLTYQVTVVLSAAFNIGYGRSRHSDKENAKNNRKQYDTYTKDKIYSRNTYNNTRKTCVTFANYCKEAFGVRYLSEIRPIMFEKFIQRGSSIGKKYEANTAASYYSEIKKLENAYYLVNNNKVTFVDKTYKQHVDENVQVKRRMPREIHDVIIEKAYQQKFDTGCAFELARAIGLRVSEITNVRKDDFKFNNGVLKSVHIHKSKGGRNRDIAVTKLSNDQIRSVTKVYNNLKDKLRDHDRLFINKAKSYETAFRRIRDSITVGDNLKGCGIHSMRKEFAQDYYEREFHNRITASEREMSEFPERKLEIQKLIEQEVKQELTEVLGHSRLEVLGSYLDE